jgi:hypothetical protein
MRGAHPPNNPECAFWRKVFYVPDECAGLLHLTYDEIFAKLKWLKIDCIRILSIMRVPWWSLAGYLIDPGDDIDAAVYEYLDSLPHPPKLKQQGDNE